MCAGRGPRRGGSRRPTAVKQPPVVHDALLVGVRKHADRRAAQVVIGAEPLVSVRRHPPTGLADPEGQIGLVPFGRHERLVEHPTASRHARRTAHGRMTTSTSCRRIQFSGRGPIVLCRRRQSTRSSQVLIGFVDGIAVQPAAEAEQPEIRIRGRRSRRSSGTSHATSQEHVVLPGQHAAAPRASRRPRLVAAQLVNVVLVDPPQVPPPPRRGRDAPRAAARCPIAAAVFDRRRARPARCRHGAASCVRHALEHVGVVERRDHDGEHGARDHAVRPERGDRMREVEAGVDTASAARAPSCARRVGIGRRAPPRPLQGPRDRRPATRTAAPLDGPESPRSARRWSSRSARACESAAMALVRRLLTPSG